VSFFLHKTGRGRQRVVKIVPSATNISVCSRLPRSGDEIAAIAVSGGSVDWFWSGVNTGKGYWADYLTSVKTITTSGLVSYGFQCDIVDAYKNALPATIFSNMTFSSNVSFAIAIFLRIAERSSDDFSSVFRANPAGAPMLQTYSYGVSGRYYAYLLTPEQASSLASELYSKGGALGLVLFGWDSRTRKAWTTLGGNVNYGVDMVTGNWGSSGALYNTRAGGGCSVIQAAKFSGATAESIRDNISTFRTNLLALFGGNGGLTSSCSSIFHRTTSTTYDVSNANLPYANDDGLPIHSALTNLMLNSRGMADWTLDGVTKEDWKSLASDGIRGLTGVYETIADDEHKATIAVTALATGRHWFEFTCRMSSIAAISIEISNGTDASYVSFDPAGNDTDYVVRTAETQFETLGYRLFRVKLPVDVTSLDAFTITARALAFDGSAWVDTYVGVVNRVAYLGDWSFVASVGKPLVIPISIGAASTAIVPIVDWVDAKALNRLKDAKMETRIRVAVDKWLTQDYCLWTWRKDANNAVEVWIRYTGTSDSRQTYTLKINVIIAGSATETALNTGIWVLDSSVGVYLRDLSLSVSIDSLGVCKWWVRGEPVDAGVPIFEDSNFQAGEQTIGSYTAPVVTSVRLGSSAAGTGQQPMTIKEVLAW
jgi:hypothetical protein